jgi:hypothetical protein
MSNKKAGQFTPRRRAHDVVIWCEQDEWIVYDSVADKCYRFNDGTPNENHAEALKKFREIKQIDKKARAL